MKTPPKTPRLLAALGALSLAALLCPGRPARAQGQWYPGYVPCYADGTPVPPAMTDGKGLEVMAGTLTGRPAGGQSIPYAQYGRYLYSFNPNSPSVPDPFPYDPLADSSIPGLWVSSRNGLLSSDGPDVSVTSGASGQVQVSLHAYFLWRPGYDCDNPPSGPPPPPPPTASFLLQTQLSASYSASYQRQPFASGPDPTAGISAQAQVQDGYGELAQVIAPAPPYPYSYGSYGVNGTAPAGGLHLVTVGVQTVGGKGIYTINLSGSAQAQAANSLNGANFVGEASATATLNGGAKHDSRAVTLSRNGARQVNKVAGPNGQVYGEWVDPDGTGHGDTTYSYWAEYNDPGPFGGPGIDNFLNWQTFQPNFKGTWPLWPTTWNYSGDTAGNWWWYTGDPNDPLYTSDVENTDGETALARTQNAPAVTWSWLPNETADWELYGKWSAPDGSGTGWDALGNPDPNLTRPSPPVTKPITYKVSESVSQHFPWQNNLSILDGAQAATTYYLTFHDPVDGWHTNGPAYEIDPLLYPNAVADGQPTSYPAGATIQTAIPKQLDYIDYGPGVRSVGGLLTTGAAVFPLVIGADAASGPLGLGLTGLMVSTGFTAGLYDPKEPKWTKDVPTDETYFLQDIADQQKISAGTAVASPFGAPNYVLAPKVPRFADPRRADDLTNMSPNQQYQYWVGTGLGGKYMVSATDVLHQGVQPYAAYQFDTAGLLVDANNQPVFALGNVKRSGALEAVRTWTWVADGTPGH